MIFGRIEAGNFERGIYKNWIITNGLGGFAAGTIIGANNSKYHGLLFAALRPPGDRRLLLAKLEEEVILRGQSHLLGANETATGIYPDGFGYIQTFELNPFPHFTYVVKDVMLEKTIFMIQGSNTTVVRYSVFCPDEAEITMRITPFVNNRHYHHTTRKNDWPFHQQVQEKGTVIEAYEGAPKLCLYSDRALYEKGRGYWFENIFYRNESRRGLDSWEDHYMPGSFVISVKNEDSFAIIASADGEDKVTNPLLKQIEQEKRLAHLVEQSGLSDNFASRLVIAADSFIVDRKSTQSKTVIAGYPWFTDWGRDTMIALPGLTLVTRRFEDARDILQTFARYCKDGLIPNMFPDEGTKPLYNTVDAPLWFFYAVYKYLQYTEDYDFVKREVYSALKDIVKHYREGTHFNIHMDKDGLISAGTEDIQLTWMDAKVGDWVVTPRQGKAVEINALWYNALQIMALLARKFSEQSEEYTELAKRVRKSFVEVFWNQEGKYLYDVVKGGHKDSSIRPNQIFAVSLPFALLDHTKEVAVVNTVWQHLYFSYGLRSLAPGSPDYKGVYQGDVVERDAAYHQGTGWSWLLGHFITAYRKINDYSSRSREVAMQFILPFKAHLREHGLGTVSEIFDGDTPFRPKGCFSQAWGVAEVLRAYVEDVLEERKN